MLSLTEMLNLPGWKWRSYKIPYVIGVLSFLFAFFFHQQTVTHPDLISNVEKLDAMSVDEAESQTGLVKIMVLPEEISINKDDLLQLPDDYSEIYPYQDLFCYDVSTILTTLEFYAGTTERHSRLHGGSAIVPEFMVGNIVIEPAKARLQWHYTNSDSTRKGLVDGSKEWNASWTSISDLETLEIIGELKEGRISSGSPFILTNSEQPCYTSDLALSWLFEIVTAWFWFSMSMIGLLFPLFQGRKAKNIQNCTLWAFLLTFLIPSVIVFSMLVLPQYWVYFLITFLILLLLLLIWSVRK